MVSTEPPPSPAPAVSIDGPDLPPSLASGFRVHAYDLVSLKIQDRAYSDQPDAPLTVDYPADANGVPQYVRDGRTYLHPVSAAQQGLRQLSSYVRTRKAIYLERARVIADALIAAAVDVDGALWIPYRFDFALHGKRADLMQAPWYSGMAQGQVLSLVTRLYDLTGASGYLADARRVFRSFVHVGQRSGPWVSWVEKRYLWIEEYPGTPPDHTLNGFMFALYGVYDYEATTHDPEAVRVFQGGLTTLQAYLPEFRDPSGISRYCLRHGVPSPKYHHIHIGQLRQLMKMTGDAFFGRVAAQFEADHH